MTHTSIVSPQGQTSIPAPIRKHLGLKPGQKLTWNIQKNNAGVEEITISTPSAIILKSLKGIAKDLYKEEGGGDKYLENERNSWDK